MSLLHHSPTFFKRTLSTTIHSRESNKLSLRAWSYAHRIIEAIKHHPFNQEMLAGTLDQDIFNYYLQQDLHYLKAYSEANRLIAARIATRYAPAFQKSSEYTAGIEQKTVHHAFKNQFNSSLSNHPPNPATQRYCDYLMHIAQHEPVTQAVASIVPCYWIYLELSQMISQFPQKNNYYAPWFKTYSGDVFRQKTNEKIRIFDELGSQETLLNQQLMLEQFRKSMLYEWHFWNNAYHLAEMRAYKQA